MAVRLYLVRHAESTWNAEGRVQGQADPPLNERGLMQAARVANRFRSEHVGILYSSPLQRARQTAEVIAMATGLQIHYEDQLKEHDLGLFTGQVYAEIVEQFPELSQFWMEEARDMPGGEKQYAFHSRAAGTIRAIAERHANAKIAIVSHAGLFCEYLAYLLELDRKRHHPFQFDNASVSIVEVGGPLPRIIRLNDISHLVPSTSPLSPEDLPVVEDDGAQPASGEL